MSDVQGLLPEIRKLLGEKRFSDVDTLPVPEAQELVAGGLKNGGGKRLEIGFLEKENVITKPLYLYIAQVLLYTYLSPRSDHDQMIK